MARDCGSRWSELLPAINNSKKKKKKTSNNNNNWFEIVRHVAEKQNKKTGPEQDLKPKAGFRHGPETILSGIGLQTTESKQENFYAEFRVQGLGFRVSGLGQET